MSNTLIIKGSDQAHPARLFIGLARGAQAGRILPLDGVAGELKDSQYPCVLISGKQFHLAAGSMIFDPNNRIILPGPLPQKVPVLYQLGGGDDLIQMWLLTPEEITNLKNLDRGEETLH